MHIDGHAIGAKILDKAQIPLLMLGHAVVDDEHSVDFAVLRQILIADDLTDAGLGGEMELQLQHVLLLPFYDLLASTH